MTTSSATRRDVQEWSPVAVRLLQGVVEFDDERMWDLVLRHRSTLESYLARIGLILVVDAADGYAFVRQSKEGELGEEAADIPKLLRRRILGYSATVLSVLLREELRRSDEQVDRPRCTVELGTLYDTWRTFVPGSNDDKTTRRDFDAALATVREVGFIRPLGESKETIEVRRVIKARLPVEELERLRDDLQREVERRAETVRKDNE